MQQMHPDEQRNYQGYEGAQAYERQRSGETYNTSSMYDDEFVDGLAQRLSQRMAQGPAGKIQPTASRHGASAGQRLALAIVSVSLLAFVALVLVGNSAVSSLVALIVLGLLSVMFIIINGIFNAMK
jgi:hypothetical protein